MTSFTSERCAAESSSREQHNDLQDKARVLLADDNPQILQLVSDLLEPKYLVVGAVTNAEDVLCETAVSKPDIVVLDIEMGASDGISVARQLHAEEPSVKIVFLTVYELAEFVRIALEAGGSAYVFKSRLNSDLIPALQAVSHGMLYISCQSPLR